MKRILTFSLLLCVAALSHAQTFVYKFSGHNETMVVPTGVHAFYAELYGAGGGISGGSAAYVAGLLYVTPGQLLTLTVGQASGGVYYNEGIAGRNFGGGGYANGAHDILAGNGGGASSISVDGTLSAVAGAGAGGTRVTIGARNTRPGGGGGTFEGGRPGNNPLPGNATGGTQNSGGSFNGGFLHGGDPQGQGAGGGGGYYGGGGGGNANLGNYWLFPGAGGSSFWGGLKNATYEAGQTGNVSGDVLPGGANAANYQFGIGVGGFNSGGHGMIVLTAAPVPEPSSLAAGALGLLAYSRRRSRRVA